MVINLMTPIITHLNFSLCDDDFSQLRNSVKTNRNDPYTKPICTQLITLDLYGQCSNWDRFTTTAAMLMQCKPLTAKKLRKKSDPFTTIRELVSHTLQQLVTKSWLN